MRKRLLGIGLMLLVVLAACTEEMFQPIEADESFVASVNIINPSILFYNESREKIAHWQFEKAITGAVLIGEDKLITYGHQLDELQLISLTTGKIDKIIEVEIGTTNVYYDEALKQFFITNSNTNEVIAYREDGGKKFTTKLRNYPMSMVAYGEHLYVINYKDTYLSVVDTRNGEVIKEWPIAKSSHGMLVLDEVNELWIGGHGEGTEPNRSIDVFDLQSGLLKTEIDMPLMPIGLIKNQQEIAVVSHGQNQFYIANQTGKILWQKEVGANPFAVTAFQNQYVVAGYDDQTLYFIEDRQVIHRVETEKGPFQLLIREVVK